jgi:hypothetical protein
LLSLLTHTAIEQYVIELSGCNQPILSTWAYRQNNALAKGRVDFECFW